MNKTEANRLCLLAAFAVNLIITAVYAPPLSAYPWHSVLSEAIGLTIPMAIGPLLAQWWLKQPRVYHGWTLGLAVVLAFGRYYAKLTNGPN